MRKYAQPPESGGNEEGWSCPEWAVCQRSCSSGFPVCFQNGHQVHVNNMLLKLPLKVSTYGHVYYVLLTAVCCKYQCMWRDEFIPVCFGTVLCATGARMLGNVFAMKYFHLGELRISKCMIVNKKYLTAGFDSIISKTDASGFSF